MRRYDPSLLIIDTPFPYDKSTKFVDYLGTFDVSYGKHIILTTTGRPTVESFVAHHKNITFLDKPFDFEELEEMLGRLTTPRRSMRLSR